MASHMLHRASHAKGKVRNSSIELLRVIAMLLIVTQHSVVHSICNPSTAPLSVPMLFATMLGGRYDRVYRRTALLRYQRMVPVQ